MKKIFFVSISVLLIFVTALQCLAVDNSAKCWYYKRQGNKTPLFPSDAAFIKEHGGYFLGDECEKKIYLTFDAGYENGNVSKILDILKEEKAPGAFFILKHLVLENPELIKRMDSEGHLVCNHTKNHKDMTTLTEEEMKLNLRFLEDLCYEKTGVRMSKFFRFPEGRYSERTVITAEECGYKTVFWSLSHADWDNNRQPNPEKSYNLLIENTHNGMIVLLHPTSQTNVEILSRLIKAWRAMGYTIDSLDNLIK